MDTDDAFDRIRRLAGGSEESTVLIDIEKVLGYVEKEGPVTSRELNRYLEMKNAGFVLLELSRNGLVEQGDYKITEMPVKIKTDEFELEKNGKVGIGHTITEKGRELLGRLREAGEEERYLVFQMESVDMTRFFKSLGF